MRSILITKYLLIISTLSSYAANRINNVVMSSKYSLRFTARTPFRLFGVTINYNNKTLRAEINDHHEQFNPPFARPKIFSLRAGNQSMDDSPSDDRGNSETDVDKEVDGNDDDSIDNLDNNNNNNNNIHEESGISNELEEQYDHDETTLLKERDIVSDCSNDDGSDASLSNNDHSISLLPYHYYTQIFHTGNGVSTRGKFYSNKERIKNLLSKWENDDMNDTFKIQQEDNEELKNILSLIYERAKEYIDDVNEAVTKSLEKGKLSSIPHPKKVLHFIAPKIAAIKRSPEIMLRVTSARVDVDVPAASCALSIMGIVTQYYVYKLEKLELRLAEKDIKSIKQDVKSTFETIVTDRRFEQLVECIKCGVNVDKLMEGDNVISDAIQEEGISIIDATKVVWALSIFLTRHHVDALGEKDCSSFVHALIKRSYYLLRNNLIDIQNASESNQTSNTQSQFLKEIHVLLRNTIYVLWTLDCAAELFEHDNSMILATCIDILNQDIKNIWESRQKQINDEANIDDIVERLAEAEEGDKEIGTNVISTETENTINDFSIVKDDIFSSMLPGTYFVLDYLSCHDLLIAFNAIHNMKITIDKGEVHRLLNRINMWVDHDLDINLNPETEVCNNNDDDDNDTPDEVKLVNAASILSAETGIESNSGEYFNNGTDIDLRFEKRKPALSMNDLGLLLSSKGIIDQNIDPLLIDKIFRLYFLYSGSLEYMENEFLLQIFRGVSSHVAVVLNFASDPKPLIQLCSTITDEVFDRFYEEKLLFKVLSESDLTSLLSSLYKMSITLKSSNHFDVVDETKTLNAFKVSIRHISDDEDLDISHLCKIAAVFADYQNALNERSNRYNLLSIIQLFP